jgi:hypothetical protein
MKSKKHEPIAELENRPEGAVYFNPKATPWGRKQYIRKGALKGQFNFKT